MTNKKTFKKQIKGLENQIELHLKKIEIEKTKNFPLKGRIKHWESDIRVFEGNIAKAKKRFERGR